MNDFLFPPRASTLAGDVDLLYSFLVLTAVTMIALIFGAMIVFAIRYRRSRAAQTAREGRRINDWALLELGWTFAPFCIMLVMFGWGAKLYFDESRPPGDALEIYVVGKQWMWKLQHEGGRSEINTMHVPVGRPVKLIMASEDVIHSFYVPAFRVKRDVVPGRYSTLWFQATETGTFPFHCAEYCGTDHSRMGGTVTVMDPADYEAWLAGVKRGMSTSERGAELFEDYGCASCHLTATQGRCPPLTNVFNHTVELDNGSTVLADEEYIRRSVLEPNAQIVSGYSANLMPNFQGQVSEEDLLLLIAYIKSLSQPELAAPTQGAAE